jgi:biotin operon repressor
MVPGQKGSKGNGSADSRAASGNALVAWGSVTGSKSLVKRGQRQIMEALPYVLGSVGNLKRHSKHKGVPVSVLSLEDEYNLTLAHVIEGAGSLRNLGIDIYSVKKNGRNLHDAVDWWTSVMRTRPQAFLGYRRKSHNWHVGWIPIYLHHNGNRPVAANLRKIERDVTGGRRPGFQAISLGGATDCLW